MTTGRINQVATSLVAATAATAAV